MRIIGGRWADTPLVSPSGRVRPTSEVLREAWMTELGDQLKGTRILDLFAGSGALGFEAASRGARSVTMVDTHTPVIRQLDTIKGKLKADAVTLVRGDALTTGAGMALRGQRYDLVFLDPPYNQDFLAKSLPLCAKLLKPGGLVYAESGAPLPFEPEDGSPAPDWLGPWEAIRADKAGIVFYHLLKLQSNPA